MMIITRLVDIFLAAGAVQGFFLALVLTTKKNSPSRSNRILAALLIVLSLSVLHSILRSSLLGSRNSIGEPFVFFIGPMLYFYTLEHTGIRKVTSRDSLHFLPFLIVVLLLIPAWASNSTAYAMFADRNAYALKTGLWSLIVLHYGYYWVRTVSLLHTHRRAVESEFSNIEGKTLAWLSFFLHVFGTFLLILLLSLTFALHSARYEVIDAVVGLALSAAVFALGYYGLMQETVAPVTHLPGVQDEGPRPTKKVKPRTKGDSKSLERLTTHMEKSKPHLNESLTLTELAEQLGMTRNELSSIINSEYGENFYSFVNLRRVEEAKRLLADPDKAHFTILSLAYEAGFPSKSTFHSAFKKSTGLTPTQFRKNLR